MRASLLRSCGVIVALGLLLVTLPAQPVVAATIDGQFDQTGPLGAGTVFNLPVLGRGGVPASGVGSVALNVTVTRPSATSFVTVWPTGQPRPNASNLNFVPGQTVPNMVIVPVGAGGQISIFNESGTTDVLVDVLGWFPEGSSFTGLTPARLLDSRVPSGGTVDGAFNGIGTLAGGTVFNLPVSGRGGVPGSGVGSVALNVTVARPSATSFLSVWPAGQPRPNASNLNFVAGQTVPNMVIVPVGAGGQISIFNESGTTDVLVDVLGWFPTGPSFTGLTPGRLLDTRVPSGGTVDGAFSGGGQLGGGTVFNLPVSGRGGVPASGAGSVALNVTVARPSEAGFLTVWPKGQPRPNASNLNFTPGQTVPNMVIVPIGADGQISIINESGTTDVLVDVLGWFPISSSFTGLTPARLLDSRKPIPPPVTPPPTTTPPTNPGDAKSFQAVYAVPADRTAVDGRVAAFAHEVSVVQDWYDSQTGGRHPIFETDGPQVQVITVNLPQTYSEIRNNPNPESVIEQSIRSVNPSKLANVRLVVVLEGQSGTYCGRTGQIVFIPVDNCSILPSGASAWPGGMSYLLGHELAHAMGAVPSCAPHASGGHVNDDPRDLLYQGPKPRDWTNLTLDPGNDDYFRHSNPSCVDIDDSVLLGTA